MLTRENRHFIIFTGVVIVASVVYAGWVFAQGGTSYIDQDSALSELGESLGVIGFWALGLIYGRTLLKLILRRQDFWQRLAPIEETEFSPAVNSLRRILQYALIYLTRYHSYIGVMAVVTIFLHCYLTSALVDNLLLRAVLVIMAWQGVFGLFMKLKFTPQVLKQKGHLIHAQFSTGILILILAGLGHMILAPSGRNFQKSVRNIASPTTTPFNNDR